MKKILFIIWVLLLFGLNGSYADEYEIANIIDRMNTKGMTKYTTINEFRVNDNVTREEAAKLITQYALQDFYYTSNFTKGSECYFTDKTLFDITLKQYIQDSCAYNLLKGYNGKFHPKKNLTQAQAIAIVMRVRGGLLPEDGKFWFKSYYDSARQWGLFTNTSITGINMVDNINITRGDLATLLYNSSKSTWDVQFKNKVVDVNSVVYVDYNLRTKKDNILHQTTSDSLAKQHWIYEQERDYKPLEINMRDEEFLEGLESGLIGMKEGEKRILTVYPEFGYGYWQDNLLVEDIAPPFNNYNGMPEIGMWITTNITLPDGTVKYANGEVLDVHGNRLTVDFNHPLAGEILLIDVEIIKIR